MGLPLGLLHLVLRAEDPEGALSLPCFSPPLSSQFCSSMSPTLRTSAEGEEVSVTDDLQTQVPGTLQTYAT